MKILFGILSGVIGLAATLPYVLAIYKGEVRPHRVAWLIGLLAKTLTFITQIAKSAQFSLLLNLAGIISGGIIFILSIKRGVGGVNRRDRIAFMLSMTGLVAWLLTREAFYGLFFAIAADAIGTILTVDKTYRMRGTESPITWAMATIASIFGLLAVDSYTLGQTAFPLYAVIGGFSLFLVSLLKPRSTPPAQLL